MTRWLISVPAWGERCVSVLCSVALPALERAALELVSVGDVRVIVHTDQPDRVRGAVTQIPLEFRPVPAGARDFDCLSQSHREVISMACKGDVVVFLTADLVISQFGLVYCEKRLRVSQTRTVVGAGVRALQEGRLPDTASAADLMAWAWTNRHPMTESCRYPDGDSADLSRMYFEKGGNVAARLALPHPLAVRIDGRPLRFTPTVDANLIQCFQPHEIHVAVDSMELALVELSPRDKDFARAGDSIDARLKSGGVKIPDPMQRWCLDHRVTLVGPTNEDCGDNAVIRNIRKS